MVAPEGRTRQEPVRLAAARGVWVDLRGGGAPPPGPWAGAWINGPDTALTPAFVRRVRAAADALLPAHTESLGEAGWLAVGLPCSRNAIPGTRPRTAPLPGTPPPCLACEALEGEAAALFREAGRPNMMPEVRCTEAGLGVLQSLATAGVPAFLSGAASPARLDAAWGAWLSGLEERSRAGKPLSGAGLAVRVPVGRVDAALNPLLAARMAAAPIESIRAAYRLLYGRVGVSLAKAAYRRMRIAFNGARWELLRERGARPPRLVWDLSGRPEGLEDAASRLHGPGCAVLLGPGEAAAWAPAGSTVEEEALEARRLLDKLANYQIDLDAVAASLEEGG